MGCGCDDPPAGGAVASGGGSGWTIRLRNGSTVGAYPTRAAAEQAAKTTYVGGTVVQR